LPFPGQKVEKLARLLYNIMVYFTGKEVENLIFQ